MPANRANANTPLVLGASRSPSPSDGWEVIGLATNRRLLDRRAARRADVRKGASPDRPLESVGHNGRS